MLLLCDLTMSLSSHQLTLSFGKLITASSSSDIAMSFFLRKWRLAVLGLSFFKFIQLCSTPNKFQTYIRQFAMIIYHDHGPRTILILSETSYCWFSNWLKSTQKVYKAHCWVNICFQQIKHERFDLLFVFYEKGPSVSDCGISSH